MEFTCLGEAAEEAEIEQRDIDVMEQVSSDGHRIDANSPTIERISNIQNIEKRSWKGIYPPTIGHPLVKDDNILEVVIGELSRLPNLDTNEEILEQNKKKKTNSGVQNRSKSDKESQKEGRQQTRILIE